MKKNQQEFDKWLKKASREYAMSVVVEPEDHTDAVEAIQYDFEEGAIKAYEYLTGNEFDY